MSDRPPRLAEWLFERYCGKAIVDDLRGDMEEVFHRNTAGIGRRRAKIIYWRQVLSLIFSYAIRKRKKNASHHHLSSSNTVGMFGNYLKVGFRNLLRFRYFTLINMIGLSIGMSISLLIITLFISVTDYDEFHENKNSIYRVITKKKGRQYPSAAAPAALGEKIRSEFAGIKDVVMLDRGLYSSEPQPRQDLAIYGFYAEPSFFSTFTFPLVAGDAKTALNDPKAIILTETTAKRIFGNTDVMGREVMTDNGTLEVRGIMKDFPHNTHLGFQALASYKAISKHHEQKSFEEAWTDIGSHYVYIHADKNFDPEKFQEYLDRTSKDVYSNKLKDSINFYIQPLSEITPGPEMTNSPGDEWSYQSFVVAGALALLILLPACFNYTNISIARALKRSREIGLRKTLGGVSRQIFTQFISETIIVTTLSLIGAIVVFLLVRGEFQSMLVAANALDMSLTFERFLYFLLFALFTGLVAGFLPAMHFSRLNPIDAIRNNLPTKFLSGIRLRNTLIVFQFTLCLAFILGLVIFGKQYRYALNYDLGFNDENILDIELKSVDPEVLRNEFSKVSAVQNISMSSGVIGHGVPSTWANLAGSKDSAEVYQMFVDEQFITNMDLELVGGKTFDKISGKNSVIINEVLMKRFNFAGPSEALGQVIEVDTLSLRIAGVIKTFHFWQLYAPPGNFFFRYDPEKFRLANVKIVSNDVQTTLEQMENVWKRLAPGQPFDSRFLSDETAGGFDQYKVLLKMFGFMGAIAVSISCLGLLGMVVYSAESRTKEVGIRKVMGASRASLAVLLSRKFLKLMLIASLFAIPLTLLFDWVLSGMAYYRVDVTFVDMLLGLIVMFVLGIATMASQTWRAASANPADTLKHE